MTYIWLDVLAVQVIGIGISYCINYCTIQGQLLLKLGFNTLIHWSMWNHYQSSEGTMGALNKYCMRQYWRSSLLHISRTIYCCLHQFQSGKCCALVEFLTKLWSMCVISTTTAVHALELLTTTWLETHQVHSTFRFEFARSTQSAVCMKTVSTVTSGFSTGCRQPELGDSGSRWFTLGLETNCTKPLERKLVQIILQELQP